MYPTIFAIIAFLAVLLGSEAIGAMVNNIPPVVLTALKTAGNVLPALGFAILLKTMWRADIAAFYFIGFIAAAYLGLGTVPVAIIGVSIAVIVCLNDYKHIQEIRELKSTGVKEKSETEDFFNE